MPTTVAPQEVTRQWNSVLVWRRLPFGQTLASVLRQFYRGTPRIELLKHGGASGHGGLVAPS
ncbi:MAG TPA: hypothetical protein VMT78_11030, partial [Terriglobia bacterium]|nr:hypothetical protein [Terriglobia bacterium]